MNEEGRRALGRGEANSLPSTVSWNSTSSLSTPHLFISFPRHGARHGVLALDQTTCLVRFSVYIVCRSTSCRNSFDLSFPVPRLAVFPFVRAPLAYFILPPAQQHAFPP